MYAYANVLTGAYENKKSTVPDMNPYLLLYLGKKALKGEIKTR